MSKYYVYFVRRLIEGDRICCTDLVGKVGKGSGNRKDAYRTPYGSDNLLVDTWPCNDEQDALNLESTVHDVLDLLGWLRYHAPTGKSNHRNRAEVVSFPFKGQDQASMIKEYNRNMQWIHALINYYHSIREQTVFNSPSGIKHVLSTVKGKMKNSIILRDYLPLFDLLSGSTTSKKMEQVFHSKIDIARCNDRGVKSSTGDYVLVSLSNLYKKRNGCGIM